MTNANSSPPRPHRRWYQYSLRSLFVFMTVAGCGMGWLGVKAQQGRNREAAVQEIKRLGGWVMYAPELEAAARWECGFLARGNYALHKDFDPVTRNSGGPGWLQGLLGHYCFASVGVVELKAKYGVDENGAPKTQRPTDIDLKLLEALPELQELSLFDSEITDAGLEWLTRLSRLRHLEFGSPNVTKAAIERFRRCLPDCEVKLYE